MFYRVRRNNKGGFTTLDKDHKYLLDHGVAGNYIRRVGSTCEAILLRAGSYQCNLIVMGGYGFKPVMESVWGSRVDEVLRRTVGLVLICAKVLIYGRGSILLCDWRDLWRGQQ